MNIKCSSMDSFPKKNLSFPILAVVLAACSSLPPPTSELQAAEQAISQAEKTQAPEYASVEMSDARNKLVAARESVQQEDMKQAKRLAEQSRLDAELAMAKASSFKATTINSDVEKGNESLKQEMHRNSKDGMK